MPNTISTLSVKLTANTSAFAANMTNASTTLGRVSAAFSRVTDSAKAYDSLSKNVGEVKLAGADTLASLQTVLAVARSELRKFGRNRDVQVAVEIGREYLDESWRKVQPHLQNLIDRSKIKVAAQVVADKTQDARAWINRQRVSLTKPITVRMELAKRAIGEQVATVRSKLDGLKQYRAVRITLSAVNATKMPIQAAIATLAPLRKLATSGVKVALSVSHVGVARGVQKAKALLGGLVSYGRSAASSLASGLASVASGVVGIGAMVGGAAVAGVGGLATYAIKLAADAEQARVSFTTMLGDAGKAKALIGQINQFAATTPFQTPELIDASKKLLAFGVDAQQIIPTMRSLGDVSAGLNIPLGDLAEIFGKAKVQGRLMAEDINQLTGRGIPVIGEFAKQFGVSEGEVRKLVETGKIGFPQLQQAILSMTTGSGKFAGMMAAQSQTVSGLFSTLGDTVTLSLTRIGEIITEKLDLRGVLTGITDSISAMATTAMPIIETFFGSLGAGGKIGEMAGNMVLSASQMIATGLAYVIDYSKLLVVGFKSMQAGAALAIGGLLKAVDYLGSRIVNLLNLLPGVNIQWGDTIGAMGDAVLDEANKLAGEANDAWGSFSNADSASKVASFFDQVRANAAKAKTATEDVGKAATQTAMKVEQAAAQQNTKVIDSLKDLQEQISQFGMTDAQKKIADLKAMGASPEQIAQAEADLKKLDALNAQKKAAEDMQSKAKSVFEETRTPLEKYETKIGELSDMLNKGMLDWDTYGRAVRQAREQLESDGKIADAPTLEAPDLMQAGSAQAARFAYDLSRGQNNLTDSKKDNSKLQLAEAKDSNRLLEKIARNTGISTGDELQVVDL